MDQTRADLPTAYAGSTPPPPPGTGGRLSIGACVQTSWEAFWRHPWLGLAMLGFVCIVVLAALIPFVGPLINLLLTPAATGGMLILCIHIVEERQPAVADLFAGFSRWWRFLAVQFVMGLIALLIMSPALGVLFFTGFAQRIDRGDSLLPVLPILIGAIALVMPLVTFVSIRTAFAIYLLADSSRVGAIEAIRRSWTMTRGSWWRLFGLVIVMSLIQIVGALCLVVGLIVTVPMYLLALSAAYVQLRPADLRAAPDLPVAPAPTYASSPAPSGPP